MVNSKYALRETTSKANSLENRESSYSSSSHNPSPYIDFYTEKDPQYYQHGYEASIKMTKSRKKTSRSRKGKKQNKKSKTSSTSLPSLDLQVPYNDNDTDANNRVYHPEANDVLCGRGGNINNHPGNKVFRSYVNEQKSEYNLTPDKNYKANISQSIVDMIHNLVPPGRFLMKDSSKGPDWWVEVEGTKALAKTSQALREGAPSIRAMASIKDATTSKIKNIKSLGVRKKNASHKRRYSADKDEVREESDTGQSSQVSREEYSYPQYSYPLIVPMANGHRGKQLIPHPTAEGTNEEVTAAVQNENAVHENNTLPNPCVSFDEDMDTGDNMIGKRRKIITSANAKTSLPTDADANANANTSPQSSTAPPMSWQRLSNGLDVSSGSNLSYSTPLRNNGICDPCNVTISPTSVPPALPGSGFTRAHSLAWDEANGFNESFRGDEVFVNPFLNETTNPNPKFLT